jgi:hypothetical protein
LHYHVFKRIQEVVVPVKPNALYVQRGSQRRNTSVRWEHMEHFFTMPGGMEEALSPHGEDLVIRDITVITVISLLQNEHEDDAMNGHENSPTRFIHIYQ